MRKLQRNKKIPKKQAKRKAGKDYDGDGKVESPAAEYQGSKDKAIKKAMHKESRDIINFVVAISEEKYAVANKYLQGVIEGKIERRIQQSLNEPLF